MFSLDSRRCRTDGRWCGIDGIERAVVPLEMQSAAVTTSVKPSSDRRIPSGVI